MADIEINGNTYDNTTFSKPVSIGVETVKIGTSIVAANGSRTFVQRGYKYQWTIRWEKVTEATRLALAIVAALSTTFEFVDTAGTSYTVQTEEGDHTQETAFADIAGTQYYDIDLTLRQV